MGCRECGMAAAEDDFHPFLYCLLFKAGYRDPRRFMQTAGWSYTPSQSVIPNKVRELRHAPYSDDSEGAS